MEGVELVWLFYWWHLTSNGKMQKEGIKAELGVLPVLVPVKGLAHPLKLIPFANYRGKLINHSSLIAAR